MQSVGGAILLKFNPGTSFEREWDLPQIQTDMQISTKTIWIATHRILQEAGVKTGGTVSLSQLKQRWKRTHLRHRDLAHALDSLVRGGVIRLEMGSTGPEVRLVNSDFLDNLSADEYQREVMTLAQLAWVRTQQKSKALSEGKSLRRRASDEPLIDLWKKQSAA